MKKNHELKVFDSPAKSAGVTWRSSWVAGCKANGAHE
jgi:hypothetical protein